MAEHDTPERPGSSAPPDLPPLQWYLAVGDARQGPMSWAELVRRAHAGQIAPDQLVWHEGLPQWQPASTVPGLLPPRPTAAAYAQARPASPRQLRQAEVICVVMFIWLIATVAVYLASPMLLRLTRWGPTYGLHHWGGLGVDCLVLLAPLAGLFAAIYLPLGWSTIQQLPPRSRALGLVGGFGLIALTLLSLMQRIG